MNDAHLQCAVQGRMDFKARGRAADNLYTAPHPLFTNYLVSQPTHHVHSHHKAFGRRAGVADRACHGENRLPSWHGKEDYQLSISGCPDLPEASCDWGRFWDIPQRSGTLCYR